MFWRRKKLPDVLADLTEALPITANRCAIDFANLCGIKLSKKQHIRITGEILYLLLFLLDRQLFVQYSCGIRDVSMDLVAAGLTRYVEVINQNSEAINAAGIRYYDIEFNKIRYNYLSEKYAQYKRILPESEESVSGTLLWEFGTKISKFLGGTEDAHIVVVLTILISAQMIHMAKKLKNTRL